MKTCRFSYSRWTQAICLRHVQRLLITHKRSFRKNACRWLDTKSHWMDYYILLHYYLCTGNDKRVEGCISQLTPFDSWNANMAICLLERQMPGSHQERMYAVTYASYVTAAIWQLVGHVGTFSKALEPDQLYSALAQYNRDCDVQSLQAFLKQEKCATQILFSFFDKLVFIATYEEWLGMYITKLLRRVHSCYIAKVASSYSFLKLMKDG